MFVNRLPVPTSPVPGLLIPVGVYFVHIIGIFKIKNTIKTCGGIPITLALNLFDKIVLPILIYGAEIWGTKYAGPI